MTPADHTRQPESRRLFYFADPMCSWCWGFSPVIAHVAEVARGHVPLRLVMGGLRAGESRPLTDAAKTTVRHHWEQVLDATGQPFDFGFFARDGFVYDTEPACRAVVAVRAIAPDRALAYLSAVQEAFYAGNRDVTDGSVLAELCMRVAIPPEVFQDVFAAPEIAEATAADFRLTHGAGVGGFPTLLFHGPAGWHLLAAGYRAFADLQPELESLIAS